MPLSSSATKIMGKMKKKYGKKKGKRVFYATNTIRKKKGMKSWD